MRTIIITLALCLGIIGSCANVDAGRRGVTYNTFTGNYGKTLDPGVTAIGVNWDVAEYPIEQAALDMQDVEVRSNDGLMLTIDLTTFYKLNDDPAVLQKLYASFRSDYELALITPKVREVVRDVFGQFTAEVALSKERAAITSQLESAMNEELNAEGISIVSVSLRDIDPPVTVVNAIEAKQVAAQNREKAQMESESAQIKAKGEAAAIREMQDALAQSPAYLQYLMVNNLADNIEIIYTADGTIQLLTPGKGNVADSK